MNQRDIRHLFSLRNEYRTLRYDLRNTQILCQALGNPHQSFRSVLIAGTNGKGSVARWLSAMVPGAGLYVSPHLERLNERISIGGREIADDELDRAIEAVRQASLDARSRLLYPPTYFELVTGAAFSYFQGRTAFAVLEVGLGGRLDSTNVVSQDVSVITNIGYDHQEHLGTSLAEIAVEKAGIIKEAEPVVVGPECDFDSIKKRAMGRIIDAGKLPTRIRELGDGYFEIDLETPIRNYSKLRPRLPGRHQIENLQVAIRAAECLEQAGWPIDPDGIARGVNEATWPGRLEGFSDTPRFLLDGAHNVTAVEALARFIGEYHPGGVWLIFGGMREKACEGMIEILRPHVRQLVLTKPSNTRSRDPHELSLGFPGSVVIEQIDDAIRYCNEHALADDTVVITGSLYLVGEARAALMIRQASPVAGKAGF